MCYKESWRHVLQEGLEACEDARGDAGVAPRGRNPQAHRQHMHARPALWRSAAVAPARLTSGSLLCPADLNDAFGLLQL